MCVSVGECGVWVCVGECVCVCVVGQGTKCIGSIVN